MNKVILFFLGLIAGVVIMAALCFSHNNPLNCCSSHDEQCNDDNTFSPDDGVKITAAEFRTYADSFEAHNPAIANDSSMGYWGGKIGKSALQVLINNLDTTEQFIVFRFGLDKNGLNDKTCLMLESKRTTNNGEDSTMYMRNGASIDVYCPPRCSPRPTPTPN